MTEKDVRRQSSTIQVIDRASSLMDIISQYGQPVALKTLYTETGLNPATTHRILSSLWKNGLVQRTGAGLYDLGPKLNTLSQEIISRRVLLTKAESVMRDLWTQTKAKVQLIERDGRSAVTIAQCESDSILFRVQSPEPLHNSAVGQLFLGFYGESVTRAYLQKDATHPTDDADEFARLWEGFRSCSQQGYAVVEQRDANLTTVGALVRDAADIPIAGLSVSTATPDGHTHLLPILEGSCQSLTNYLAAG